MKTPAQINVCDAICGSNELLLNETRQCTVQASYVPGRHDTIDSIPTAPKKQLLDMLTCCRAEKRRRCCCSLTAICGVKQLLLMLMDVTVADAADGGVR
jgi:hypothetical protein